MTERSEPRSKLNANLPLTTLEHARSAEPTMRFPRHLRRRMRAEAIFAFRAFRILSRPITGLVIVALVGTVIQRVFGAPPGAAAPEWGQAAFTSFGLLVLEFVSPLPEHPLARSIYYLQPLVGAFFIGEGLIKLGSTVFRKESNQEVWFEIMAKATRDHIVLCGLGTVGIRILEELAALGQHVFVIEMNSACPFLERARNQGAEVLVGDARDETLLRSANIERARAVIVATDNDLANLEIAMDAREIRGDIPVVMRLWDQKLAQKVRGALGIEVSVSTSMLAAPLFASAALDPSVVGVHRVGQTLLVVAEVVIAAESSLDGASVHALAVQESMNVLARRAQHDMSWQVQPRPDQRVVAFERIQVMMVGSRVARLHVLNRPCAEIQAAS